MQQIVDGIHAGNIYVNRNQIGAVVGSQPFGGEGLSGTGPKAGGPHYLRRFRRSRRAPAPSCREGRKVTATQLADNLPDPALGGWSTRPDRIAVLRKHLRGKGAAAIAAAAAIDFGPVDLPGPTGEANTLTLLPRGRVLCLGAGRRDAACAGDAGARRRQCRAGGGAGRAGGAAAADRQGPAGRRHRRHGRIRSSRARSASTSSLSRRRPRRLRERPRRCWPTRNGPIVPLVTRGAQPGRLCA